ncbi:unnamed protein product [Adineta steineri]|uniref:Uncharacterized protein n=1 Tax=Adineta steineri TaxID=433720 RepID=A0A813PUK6_9BILA|nr:unnamed protein product [Adineta steineri]CAF3825243.1 unnamed protein product [Adineta steineri]
MLTVNVFCLSTSSIQIIDSEIGDNNILDCPINRNKYSLPLIIQWYRSINNYSTPVASQFNDYPVHIDELYFNKYSLLINGSLKIENIQLNDNDTFECRIILIDRGLLDIKEKYFQILRVNEQPRLINHSDSLEVANHYSTVNFICQIYGIPNPTISWYKVIQQSKQTNNEENLQLLLTDNPIFTLENVDDNSAGKYRCIGKNRLGSIENEFQLFIRGSIYWRQLPQSQIAKIHDNITLKCEGESNELLQYQWLKNEVPISDTISSLDRIHTFSDGVLSINNIQPSDHGSYVCVISILNTTNIRSKPATVTVKYPPIPSRTRQTNNLTLIHGSLGICPCLLDAYPPIQSVSWYRNGRSIRIEPKGGTYTINSEYALIIKSVDGDDNGLYYCRAQNAEGFGNDSITFRVDIKEPIKFMIKPNSIYHVQEKDRLVVPCAVYGDPQPTIKWFKNSIELNRINENLTLEHIEKTDHGLYICQASNKHTTTNISTLLIVENTTPQAPLNIQYKQIASNLLISWEPGYDGGHSQHFIIWYRIIENKKQNWNQIRVLPNNATEFFLFDLKLQQTYEVTIVAENSIGLGIFSPIISIYLNDNQDLSIGYLHYSNETNFLRPLSPTNLRLSNSGSNLHITWNQADLFDSPINIVSYVIQWRSTIVFNNQQSQQFIVVPYPIRSYILKDIKESKYIIQIMSYSNQGTYSIPIESDINIQFNSILAYHGSSRFLISILCFLTVLTVATVCIGIFCVLKHYYHRRSYCTNHKTDSMFTCWCFPSIQYRLNSCSSMEKEQRYCASLLKSNDLQSSPIYTSRQKMTSQITTKPHRPLSSSDSFTDSSISLAKVTTIPSCRNSIISNTIEIQPLTCNLLSTENSHVIPSSTLTFVLVPNTNDDTKMTSFFQPISVSNASSISHNDMESRKNSSRLPLEAVPELSELNVANSRYSFTPSVSSIAHHPHSIQPSPVLVTFDSNSSKHPI